MSYYKSITEVMAASRLKEDCVEKLRIMSCDEVYITLKALLRKAGEQTNMAKQLIHCTRCQEMANIIYGKSDFIAFNKKENLRQYYRFICQAVESLKKKLDDIYGKKQTVGHRTILSPVLITPKDLIPLTHKPLGLSAVILDIRSDQSECLAVPLQFDVTVISIPRDTILPGYFTSQNTCTMFYMLSSCDRVVLLDDKTPPIVDGKIDPESHAGILHLAIYDHCAKENPNFQLLCFTGGIGRWKREYPNYIHFADNEQFDRERHHEKIPVDVSCQTDELTYDTLVPNIDCPICYDTFSPSDVYVCTNRGCRRLLCLQCYYRLSEDIRETLCSFCRNTFNYVPLIFPRIES